MVDFKKLMVESLMLKNIRANSCVETDNHDYRYWLARSIDGSPVRIAEGIGRGIIFVMLNPSTAREIKRDPTDNRCQGFAAKFGAQWYGIVNLFAVSSPHPEDIFDYGYDSAIGPENDDYIRTVFREALDHNWPVVCGWGKPTLRVAQNKLIAQRAHEVMTAYNARRNSSLAMNTRHRLPGAVLPSPLYCLEHAACGKWPRHPLYLGQAEGRLIPHIDTYSEYL